MNIVIKLPNDLVDKIQCYPMLHFLHKYFKKLIEEKNAQIDDELQHEILSIHLISTKENIEVLNLLPFNAYYHELDIEDLKTVFSIHRAIVNSKLEKADIFITTTDSFVDASIGKNLGAKTKIGFGIGKNTFLLTSKVNLLSGRKKSEQVFELMRPLVDEMPDSIPNVCSRDMQAYFLDWRENPYVMINLPLDGEDIRADYKELFDLSEGVNFVLMSSELEDEKYADTLKAYIETLNKKNTYKILASKSYIDFAKAVTFSWTFITEENNYFQVAAYCGANIHHLYSDNHYQAFGDDYFYSDTRQFNLKEAIYKKENETDYSKIFDPIINFINQKQDELKESTKN